MSAFTQEIEVAGREGGPFRLFEAVVDSGAMFTQLPTSILTQMAVTPIDRARFELADERIIESPLGEVVIKIGARARRTVCVFGEEETPPILGAYTLEGFMLGVDPVNRRLVPIVGMRLTRIPPGLRGRRQK
jgi:predicted aspartyl protease